MILKSFCIQKKQKTKWQHIHWESSLPITYPTEVTFSNIQSTKTECQEIK